MEEIWKDIDGYEGLYQVSNFGRIKSLERTVWDSARGYYRTVHERILKTIKDRNGYLVVNLNKDGRKKQHKVHRLVGQAFCENPMGYNEINHIDEDKANNRADNLEFCSRAYNNTYNGRAKRIGEKQGKPVIAIDKITGLIVEFLSIREAERKLGIAQGNICACLKGRCKSCGGFYWFYVNDITE